MSSDLKAPKKARPTVAFEASPGSKGFKMLCHEMYERFGGCYNNLMKGLTINLEERKLLAAQLHELRTEVRALLEKARGT